MINPNPPYDLSAADGAGAVTGSPPLGAAPAFLSSISDPSNQGGHDAKSALVCFENLDDLIDGRRRLPGTVAEHQPPEETVHDDAPGESAADEISPLISTVAPAFLSLMVTA